MLKLHSYWRSSASYRVRIALNLKGLDYEILPVNLIKDGGEQHSAEYKQLNPAELVPTLVDDQLEQDFHLNQSLAIIEYLDEKYPSPALLPTSKIQKAKIRAAAYDFVSDTQPLHNLRVLQFLENDMRLSEQQKKHWIIHWVELGLRSFEKRIQHSAGEFCFGFEVSLADVCLVPQVYSAKRFDVDMSQYPVICRVSENCEKLEAFVKAKPENQSDSP